MQYVRRDVFCQPAGITAVSGGGRRAVHFRGLAGVVGEAESRSTSFRSPTVWLKTRTAIDASATAQDALCQCIGLPVGA